jgi:hypothetical protein
MNKTTFWKENEKNELNGTGYPVEKNISPIHLDPV